MATVDVFRQHPGSWAAVTSAVTVAGAAAIGWILAGRGPLPADIGSWPLTALVAVLSYGLCGAILIDRRPDLPFGWLLAVTAATQVIGLVSSVAAFHAFQAGHAGPAVRAGAAGASVGFLPVAVQGLVNVRFPSGRPASSKGRLLEWLIGGGTLLALIGGGILEATTLPDLPTEDRPAPRLGTAGHVAAELGEALLFLVPIVVLLGLLAGIGVVIRFLRSEGVERQQLKWRAVAVVVSLALFPLAVAEVTDWLDPFDSVLFVLTLAIPVLRYRLWSIDIIIRRSVLYSILTVLLAAVYLTVAVVGAAIVSGEVGTSAAVVAVVLAFSPLRQRAQRVIDRFAHGDRGDPTATIKRLSRRLGEIDRPGEALPAIVDTVASSLRLPYVAIERADGTVLATHGSSDAGLERWPLVYDGVVQGSLVATRRRGEDTMDDRDRALLADVAHHAGLAVHAEVLTADLVASRQRLVTAREEERRRLGRELHDGLGPILTGIGLNLDAARAQLRIDPGAAEGFLADAKEAGARAIQDVRRLAYDLRPPILDNLGLLGALRQHARQRSTIGLRVTITADDLPALPAAIEVAAYRAVLEAITNAVRHGHAGHCDVGLRAEQGDLIVSVDDDGTSDGPWTPGVGLLSLRERADELRGAVAAGPLDTGGARVEVRYPIGELPA